MSTLIGLYNPKTPVNVGSVMRAAGCYQAQEVRYCGERFARAAKFHTDTKQAARRIPLVSCDDLSADLPADCQIVCIEFAEGATALPEFVHPANAIYLFGPEDGSLPQEVVDKADHVVYIPTVGCMNLAATVNVVLYDKLAKSAATVDHQQRIRTSRDVNNHLKVRD